MTEARWKRLWMLVLMILSVAALNAQARTPTEIRTAIKSKMVDRHPDHIEEFWNDLGPEALPVLKKMFTETSIPFERAWIIDGLSHYDDPSIGALLQSEISGQTDEVMRRKLLSGLIRSQGDAAYDFAEEYLRDSDPHVRQAVAQGLKQYAGNSARVQKRLSEFMQEEKEGWIKTAVDKTQSVARTLKQDRNIYSESPPVAPSPTPLPQKNWVGEWKGAWITPDKNSAASLNLTMVNDKATEAQQKWRIELKLPKQSKQELKEHDLEISVFTGASVHWLEIRNKKSDAVFIAHRKPKE